MSSTNVCWAPAGTKDDESCVVEVRADIVFFASSVQFIGNAADYFSEAQEYFKAKHPDVIVGTGDNLRDIIEGMNAAKKTTGSQPFGDVHIVAHGSERAWLMRALPVKTAGPTMEESDLWASERLTLNDLMRIFLLQLDGKFPCLDAGVVDAFTRIIVYSCDLGLVPHMLDGISHVLGWSARARPKGSRNVGVTPIVLAPTAWVFFRRPTAGADPEVRLFDLYHFAVIPGKATAASFAPDAAMQAEIAKQLKALYPSTPSAAIDDMVKLTKPWMAKAPANGWVEITSQPGATLNATIIVSDTGELSYIATRRAEPDDEGYIVPATTSTVVITGVQEAQLQAQAKEVFAQAIWGIVTIPKVWWDLRLWNLVVTVSAPTPAQPFVAANPFTGTSEVPASPKTYVLTGTFSATFVSYFIMRVEGGAPVPFDPDGSALVRSTYATRNAPGGFYELPRARNTFVIQEAGKALSDYRAANP